MQDLSDLVALSLVARERSFTRAATQLGVSQSSLSRTIRSLEERVGTLLVTRTTRSVALTEAGERLLTAIGPKLQEIDAEVRSLMEIRNKPVGTVRITTTDYAANQYVWPKIQSTLRENPDLKIEIVNDYGLANIVDQRFDIGIRLGDQIEKDMIAVRIAPDETFAIVASPSYLREIAPPKRPQDLTTHRCINLRLPTRDAYMPWELGKGRRRIDVKVEGQLAFNNAYQMLDAARAGFGLAYVPEALAEPYVAKGELKWVLENWFPTIPGHHAYYATRRQSSLAVRLVIDALKTV